MKREISLVFPNQLFENHPAFAKGRIVVLYEEPLLFGNDKHWPMLVHKKRLLLHRASMRAYRQQLETQGFEVLLAENNGAEKVAVFNLLEKCLAQHQWPLAELEIHLADPEDDLITRRLEKWAARHGVELKWYASPMFLTPRDWGLATMNRTQKPLMHSFYQHQRKRLGVLVDANQKPLGGKWSFDAENRKKLPKKQAVPEMLFHTYPEWLGEEEARVHEQFSNTVGSSWGFEYPITHQQARAGLEDFLENRFALFGDYEDAISTKHRHIFHSVLTPALNIGLLAPDEVLERALEFAQHNNVPLNSLEGFVRQIIGWREFIRLVYRQYGREQRTRNYWGHTRKIPKSFYNGTTGIVPIDHIIHQVLETGYCHHIERLMVLGNFFLLCRFDPDEVYRWFMEMFIDAYDWVMVPNVYGMTQFADGGIFATKPYIGGSNYLKKMSDFPKGDGEWQATWDTLFWAFVIDHQSFFRAQPRLGMMTRHLDTRGADWQEKVLAEAAAFFENLDTE